MKKKRINYKTVLKVAVSIVLIVYLFTKIEISSLKRLSFDISLYIVAAVILLISFVSSMALRWKMILNIINATTVKFIELYRIYLIAFFFNIFLPGAIGGDIVRIKKSSEMYNVGIKKSTAVVLLERISGLVALSFLFCIGFIIYDQPIIPKLKVNKPFVFIIIGVMVIIIIAFKKYMERKLSVNYQLITIVILLSGIGQFVDIILAYMYSHYFSIDISIIELMLIMPLVYVVTVLPISLGGIGVREGAMVGLMSIFTTASTSEAVMVSFLIYLSKIGAGLVGWLVYLRSKS